MICSNNTLISIMGEDIGGLTLTNPLEHSYYKKIKIQEYSCYYLVQCPNEK